MEEAALPSIQQTMRHASRRAEANGRSGICSGVGCAGWSVDDLMCVVHEHRRVVWMIAQATRDSQDARCTVARLRLRAHALPRLVRVGGAAACGNSVAEWVRVVRGGRGEGGGVECGTPCSPADAR